MSDLPENIPSLRNWIEAPAQKTRLASEISEIKLDPPAKEAWLNAYRQFLSAIAKDNYSAAKQIMQKQGWDWRSIRNPAAKGFHKDASLMFYSCWGNSGISDIIDYKTFLFFAHEDPLSLFSKEPSGGSMLHATLHSPPNPSVIKELLQRGVNPYRLNEQNKTYLMGLKKRRERTYSRKIPEEGSESYAHYKELTETISMVENFMSQHTESECVAREAALIAQYKERTPSWVQRKGHGLGQPPAFSL